MQPASRHHRFPALQLRFQIPGLLQQALHFIYPAEIRGDRRQLVEHLYQQFALIRARRQLKCRTRGFLGIRQFVKVLTARKLFALSLGEFQAQ